MSKTIITGGGIPELMARPESELPSLPENVATGQSPSAVLITCSDSRVVPHLTIRAGVGDIFVLRNAGNFVPDPDTGSSEEASVTYAMAVLRTPNIIVCGHTHCGAVKALSADPATLPTSLNKWLTNAKGVSTDTDARTQEKANVLLQVERVAQYPAVQEAISEKRVKLHAWIYDIETRQFTAHNPESGEFEPISVSES